MIVVFSLALFCVTAAVTYIWPTRPCETTFEKEVPPEQRFNTTLHRRFKPHSATISGFTAELHLERAQSQDPPEHHEEKAHNELGARWLRVPEASL